MHAANNPFPWFHFRDWRDRVCHWGLRGGAFRLEIRTDLPDYTTLKDYEPPVMTRVHASDGSLIAEYARERRLYLPASAIPALVKEAFISAEDKNFYTHAGVDPEGILARPLRVRCKATNMSKAPRPSPSKLPRIFF